MESAVCFAHKRGFFCVEMLLCAIVVLLLPLVDARATPLPSDSQLSGYKKPLQTQRPFNVAHRGASGELPEETRAAYLVRQLIKQLKVGFFCFVF